jgi:hypothetical protein
MLPVVKLVSYLVKRVRAWNPDRAAHASHTPYY